MAKAEKPPPPLSQNIPERAKEWGPGIHTFPWLPFAVTIALIAFCVGVVLVLAISNGDNVDSWRVQPSVLLSLAASGLGFCTAFIYGEGARIGWWLFLMRGGTLQEVHERWEIASSPAKAALYPLKRMRINRVLIGCLGSTAMFATGAFLQRASTVATGIKVQIVHISVPVAPQLPYPFSSIYTGRNISNDYLTTIFAKTLQQFQSRAPIAAPNSTCDGSCVTNVPGAGFAVSCNDSTYNWTIGIYSTSEDYSEKLAFQIGFNYSYDYFADDGEPVLVNPALTIDIRYKNLPLTASQYIYVVNSTTNLSTQVIGVYRHCVLRPATVLYPVLITASTTSNGTSVASTASPSNSNNTNSTNNTNILTLLGTMSTDPVIKVFNETFDSIEYSGGGSTYLAYVDTVSALYEADITIANTGARGYQIRRTTTGSPFGLFYIQGTLGLNQDIELLLNTTFRDPTADILSSLRELMFRMSVAAAADPTAGGAWAAEVFNTSTDPQDSQPMASVVPLVPPPSYFSADDSLQAVQTTLITVYKTEYLYVGLALAWVLLVLLCITPGYWRFWHLGRAVSLSPVEIARAFEAPLLVGAAGAGGCGSNEVLGEIIARLGGRKVRYGEVVVVLGEEKGRGEGDRQGVEGELRQGKAQTGLKLSVHSLSNSSSNENAVTGEKDTPAVVVKELNQAHDHTAETEATESMSTIPLPSDEHTHVNDNAHGVQPTAPVSTVLLSSNNTSHASDHANEVEPTEAASTALLSSSETTSRRPWLAVADAESVVAPRPGVLYD